MAEIRKSAVKIEQGKRTLFLTSFTVKDFMLDDFYRVDKLDVRESTGKQRILDEARAKSFGRDINKANKYNEAFLPTSVFLSTDGEVGYDENERELFFDFAPHVGVCPLDVVDGQHRIEGLKHAARENPRLLDFPIAVVLAHDMSDPEKMLQFLIVNAKQKSVDKGVVQHIISRLTQMLEIEELPHIPPWVKKQAEKGDDNNALVYAKKFNEDERSPWRGRIRFADEDRDSSRHTVNQASFVNHIKRVLLPKSHSIHHVGDVSRFGVIFNYWKAINHICVDNDIVARL